MTSIGDGGTADHDEHHRVVYARDGRVEVESSPTSGAS